MEISRRDTPFGTTYNPHSDASRGGAPGSVRIVRPHHPLVGERLTVESAGKKRVIVRLADGSRIAVPREWTDADGGQVQPSGVPVVCTSENLRDLCGVVDGIKKRALDGAA
ncbi:MAG: hypothetical protein GY723_12820 [bacterium]|nr:hypothetical protein [bacterium]